MRMPASMTGADAVLRALADQDVEVVFGHSGGAVLPICDALVRQNRVRHVLVRHEQAAVHAAGGYARAAGKVGVVLVASGPGATDVVTGLVDALMDSIPVVCLTDRVPTHLIGNDAFQACGTVGIARPATKHDRLVSDSGRPGHGGRAGPTSADPRREDWLATGASAARGGVGP
jgi:acetolactate synthase-1/2/3 large subunit